MGADWASPGATSPAPGGGANAAASAPGCAQGEVVSSGLASAGCPSLTSRLNTACGTATEATKVATQDEQQVEQVEPPPAAEGSTWLRDSKGLGMRCMKRP